MMEIEKARIAERKLKMRLKRSSLGLEGARCYDLTKAFEAAHDTACARPARFQL